MVVLPYLPSQHPQRRGCIPRLGQNQEPQPDHAWAQPGTQWGQPALTPQPTVAPQHCYSLRVPMVATVDRLGCGHPVDCHDSLPVTQQELLHLGAHTPARCSSSVSLLGTAVVRTLALPSHPYPLAPTCGTCGWWLCTLLTLAATATLAHQLGVAPVFMAYTLFSVVMFGNTVPRFENLTVGTALITPRALTPYAHCTLHTWQEAMITLFAVLNGDVVRDTFMALLPHHPITGQVRANTKLYTHYCTVRAT